MSGLTVTSLARGVATVIWQYVFTLRFALGALALLLAAVAWTAVDRIGADAPTPEQAAALRSAGWEMTKAAGIGIASLLVMLVALAIGPGNGSDDSDKDSDS